MLKNGQAALGDYGLAVHYFHQRVCQQIGGWRWIAVGRPCSEAGEDAQHRKVVPALAPAVDHL